jgi:hypothetical protein
MLSQHYHKQEQPQMLTRAAAVFRAVIAVAAASSWKATAKAAVGEGDLPQGALQFDRLLKTQKAWAELGEAVRRRGKEFSEDEWRNSRLALRQTYQQSDDMDFLIPSVQKDRRDKALGLAKRFRQIMRDMDNPVRANDVEGFLVMHADAAATLQTFLEQLQDVPEEL